MDQEVTSWLLTSPTQLVLVASHLVVLNLVLQLVFLALLKTFQFTQKAWATRLLKSFKSGAALTPTIGSKDMLAMDANMGESSLATMALNSRARNDGCGVHPC